MQNMQDFYDEKTNTFKYEPNSKEFWEKALNSKQKKEVLTGKVLALSYNGLIVDYNGLRAFMPTKNISGKKINSFEQYLNNEIDFIITNIDIVNSKITISHREIELIEEKKHRNELINSIVTEKIYSGKVVSIKNFGAFVELENNITGLLHISQISHEKIKSIDSILTIGQELKVKVIKNENGKISLSLKALEKPKAERELEVLEEVEYKKFLKDSGNASTSLSDLLDKILI